MSAVQLAIQSRLQYQFNGSNGGGLSKEFLLETADARNKIGLPRIQQSEWGLRLPNEKFILNGVPWGLRDDWGGGSDDDDDDEGDVDVVMDTGVAADDDVKAEDGEEAEEGGTAGDLFGDDFEDDAMETEDS